jgi:hypothetical protein
LRSAQRGKLLRRRLQFQLGGDRDLHTESMPHMCMKDQGYSVCV